MSIKLAAMDMDGTLLHNDKSAPADFIPWAMEHPEIILVLASGRQYYNLLEQFPGMEERFVFLAENGAVAYYRGSRLYLNPMRREDALSCLDRAYEMEDTYPILCGANSAYMNHCPRHVEEQAGLYYARLEYRDDLYSAAGEDDIVKIALYIDHKRAREAGADFRPIAEEIIHTVSGVEWIDLSLTGNNKGSGIRAIQKYFGVLPEECMAFGDFMNDYELLQSCTESYAMENACPELKKTAKYIAPSNEEDGVMAVLKSRLG